MNVLAKEQQRASDPALSPVERARLQEQFYNQYYELRRREESRWSSRLSLQQRQKIHWLILALYMLKNRLGGFSCEVLADRRGPEKDRPVIFAVTHVGKFDIEVISEAIKDHYYLLSGDFEHLQGLPDARFLALNGVIYFNETVREDRRSATERMVRLLQSGANLMYFPEGTWNLSPNLPVLPCYWGIIDVARLGGASIVPVAAEQYGRRFKVNIGSPFDVERYGTDSAEKSRAIRDLRDVLATLKYEIWETVQVRREDLHPEDWQRFVADRFAEWPGFNQAYIDGLIYRPKGVVSPQEVFSHLTRLAPCPENAFLFRKGI